MDLIAINAVGSNQLSIDEIVRRIEVIRNDSGLLLEQMSRQEIAYTENRANLQHEMDLIAQEQQLVNRQLALVKERVSASQTTSSERVRDGPANSGVAERVAAIRTEIT